MSSKNQITIPVDVMRDAGLSHGDELIIRTSGRGRIELERASDFITRYAGAMPPGTYSAGYLDELRDEWER